MEVKFTDGEAGASSQNPSWDASSPFQRPTANTWRSADNPQPAIFIWYEFKRQHQPAKISFMVPQHFGGCGAWPDCIPSKFEFIGTNDATCNQDSNWSTLCKRQYGEFDSNQLQIQMKKPLGCQVDRNQLCQDEKFRCLGLKILAYGLRNRGLYATLTKIQMWEIVE